jgi:phage gpG-like protein
MVTVTLNGMEEIQRKLAKITSSKTRIRIMRKLGMKVRMNSKKRVTSQTDLNGQSFAKRKMKLTIEGKMLSWLASRLIVNTPTDTSVTIGWRNSWESSVAAKNQFGDDRIFNKSQMGRETTGKNTPKSDTDPATRRQAQGLIKAGYKIRRNGRVRRTPTIQWITENMTIAQAGSILRALRDSKDSWHVVLPARSFLGVTDDEIYDLSTLAINEIDRAISKQTL